MNRLGRTLLLTVAIAVPALSWAPPGRAEFPASSRQKAETLRQGERMYRDGILPAGGAMRAVIRGDVEVDSTSFSCASCHLRAGLGSVEGGVVTPPTTGVMLYKPYRRPPSLNDVADRAGRYVYAKTVAERPAYTRENLAAALRFGIDPAGQVFNDIMPRYRLEDGDMDILIGYLDALSSEPSPGVTSSGYAFATIVTDDVSPADREALLSPLQTFIQATNRQADLYKDFLRSGYTPTIDMKFAFRTASLAVWELKGPPVTWQRQLTDYYREAPVFAVLGGISNQSWQPIHEFCEAQRLPCLFPITDFPVVSETDWYTFYFNKGFFQEGEAAAGFINRMEGLTAQTAIVQIVDDTPAGTMLAAGFQKAWSDLERPAVKTLKVTGRQLSDPNFLDGILVKEKPGILLLWAGATAVTALPAVLNRLAAPAHVFVSSTYLGKETAFLPEPGRGNILITYPYRLTPYVGSKESFDAKVPVLATTKTFGDRRITSRTATMLKQAVLQGLKLLYDNPYREHLYDIMSMQMDQVVPDYERLSFGPGQRYVSKGCYIMQLGNGADPALLPRSEWVNH